MGQSLEHYGPAWLYTSPFATSASAVVPTRRRAAPALESNGVLSWASRGFYGFSCTPDGLVHVYRLSDMRHWSFTPEGVSTGACARVVFVDDGEVFYDGTYNVFRQSIADLGAGD